MKKILIILLLISQYSFATNYYVKPDGLDTNTGLSDAQAWASISKVNGFTFAANDHIYFKKNGIWTEPLTVNRNNLFFEAYGTGSNPLISGFSTVATWTNLGSNIWESNTLGAKTSVDIVTVSGEQKAPGRYPNSGYYTYQSFTTTSYTASGLTGMPDFTGGECVARKERWIMDRQAITSNSGTTLNVVTTTSGYGGKTNAGLFVQKHINTLDTQGEWVFTSGKLKMYSTSTPAETKICVLDTLFDVGSRTFITIDGIDFEGAGFAAIRVMNANTITIKNCNIRNAGTYGIYVYNTPTTVIQNDSLYDVLGIAMYINNSVVTGITITSSNINRSGWIAGLGTNIDDSYSGMIVNGGTANIQYNTVDSIGYKGINFNGSNVTVHNNSISNFCMTKDDGGGIYTWSNNGNTIYTNRVVNNNIVFNSIGCAAGSNTNTTESHGIYMDGAAMDVNIYDNTVYNGSPGDAAYFFNNTSNITLRGNTGYNVNEFMHFNRLPADVDLVRTMTVTSNISYPTNLNYFYWNGSLNVPVVVTIQQDMRNMFTRIDSNYYRNLSFPFDWYYHLTSGGTFVDPAAQSFTQWQTTIGSELNSKVIGTATATLQTNPTITPTTYTFTGFSKKDVFGTTYNNSATVPAWGSLLLLDNGTVTNTPPVANAGTDQSITLPTNSTTLTGSGTDADGTIVAYSWSKVSGPAGINFATNTNATLIVNNLIEGVYIFQLTVTDNAGGFATDQVTITVNPNPNTPPVVSIRADTTIVLPTSTVSLTGSATDNGTVASYAWSKVSGPSCTISNFTTVSATASGLIQGTYVFSFTATDNEGLSTSKITTITVSPDLTPVPATSIILYNWKF